METTFVNAATVPEAVVITREELSIPLMPPNFQLPVGWHRVKNVVKSGANKGRMHTNYISPDGLKTCTSMPAVWRYLHTERPIGGYHARGPYRPRLPVVPEAPAPSVAEPAPAPSVAEPAPAPVVVPAPVEAAAAAKPGLTLHSFLSGSSATDRTPLRLLRLGLPAFSASIYEDLVESSCEYWGRVCSKFEEVEEISTAFVDGLIVEPGFTAAYDSLPAGIRALMSLRLFIFLYPNAHLSSFSGVKGLGVLQPVLCMASMGAAALGASARPSKRARHV